MVGARTLPEALRRTATTRSTHRAVVAPEGTLTYRELDLRADRFAAGLVDRGVERGERVALLLPNGLDAAVAILGTLRAGGAISPLSPLMKPGKLAHILADAGVRIVVCDAERVALAEAAADRVDGVAIAAEPGDVSGENAPPPPPLSVDLAAVIYTSGSTGEPKGVTLTHSNMTFVAGSIAESLSMHGDDRILCVLQLSFGYGLYQLLCSVLVGATLVLEPGFAFAGRVVEQLEAERITVLPGVPTVFGVLLSLRGLADRPLRDLRLLTNAGAALPEATALDLIETFPGAGLSLMYGQTECQRVCCLPPDEAPRRPTSSGIPIPGTEAWIEDEEGKRVGPGEVGELIVRGAHVMQGYWGDPELTASRLRPGRWPWERTLATGDLFRADADGFLYFVSRRDDVFKSRGEKVVPREVEETLHGVGGVRDVAVVGVPDRLLGEAVCAHVSAQEGHELDPGVLRRHCAERLEDHMIPKHVLIHDELPRLPSGKIDRTALIEQGIKRDGGDRD